MPEVQVDTERIEGLLHRLRQVWLQCECLDIHEVIGGECLWVALPPQVAKGDRARYEQFVNAHEILRSEYDQRTTDAKVSGAQLATATANLDASRQKIAAAEQHIAEKASDVRAAEAAPDLIASSQGNIAQVSGELKKSQASLHDAQLNLSYTEIVAPESGIIGRKQIEAGQKVASLLAAKWHRRTPATYR